jgi:23S rRNA (uracil1939-C5)-methyltransferase
VPFTAPGDQVRVEILFQDKRYAEGRVLEILTSSADRVVPPCPAFGRCGGCEWQHLPYERQWQAKRSGLVHALKRVEVHTENISWQEYPAERVWEYRNRIQLRGQGNSIGFYERGSKKLVPIEKCWIARPELNERITSARDAGSARPREYKLELEVFPDGEVTESWNSGHSALGFRQVHDEQNEKLIQWVSAHAGQGGTLLDLYGGSGNLSQGIAARFQEVHCVDVGAPAQPQSTTPIHFHFQRSDVLGWLKREHIRLRSSPTPFHLILDPPREGLGEDLGAIVEVLKTLPVQETLLIGCEPDPWARALHRFQKHGWDLRSLGALDFFPQTHHVEALAVLRKDR